MWLVDWRLVSYRKGIAGFSALSEGAALDDLQEGRKDQGRRDVSDSETGNDGDV